MSDETETTYFIQPVPRLNGEERQDDSNDESNTEDESSIDSTMDTKVKTKYFDDIMEKYTEPQEQIFQIHELKQQQTKMMEPHLSPTNYNTATTKNLEDEKEEDIIDEHTNPSESIVELIDEQSSVTTENAHVEYKCASEEHVGEDSYSDWLYTKFVSMDMDGKCAFQ
ncbi:hypothetical protein D918_09496 [Trichuris suis]|nr:hypothetical protein D918_09496 [Trichuris suis]